MGVSVDEDTVEKFVMPAVTSVSKKNKYADSLSYTKDGMLQKMCNEICKVVRSEIDVDSENVDSVCDTTADSIDVEDLEDTKMVPNNTYSYSVDNTKVPANSNNKSEVATEHQVKIAMANF